MRDLDLWTLLGPRDPDRDDVPGPTYAALLAGLRELADEPLAARAPLLARAFEHVAAHDPEVRAAAISVLAGATGIVGLRAIVAALDDEVDEVRAAAVAALRASAGSGEELRLAHGLFHPRADVRRQAVAELPHGLHWIGGYLRQDPVCAEVVAKLPLALGLRVALELHARGLASDAELAHALARDDDEQLIALLRYRPRRTKLELREFRQWLDGHGPAPSRPALGRDWLDDLVVALDRAAAGGARIGGAMATLVRVHRHADAGERLVATIVLRLVEHGRIADPLLTFAVREDPRILASEAIPLAARKAAARLLGRSEPRTAGDLELGEALLASPLVRRGDGTLDLCLAASVAWLLPAPQYARLIALLGTPTVLAALLAGDVDGFTALCRLPEASPELRDQYADLAPFSPVALIPDGATGLPARLRAAAISTWSGQRGRVRALIDGLDREALHACVLAMVALDDEQVTGGGKPSSNLATLLIEALPEADRPGLAAGLLDRAWARAAAKRVDEGPNPLEAALLLRCLREIDEAKLALFVRALPLPSLLRLLAWMRTEVQLPLRSEAAVIKVLHNHPEARVREAITELGTPAATVIERQQIVDCHTLSHNEMVAIASRAWVDLGLALEPALRQPTRLLVGALRLRSDERPSLDACVALLGCHDPLEDVGERFGFYFDADAPEFALTVARAAVRLWQRNPGLGPIGHAWLHRFEQHALAFGEWWVAQPEGVVPTLARCVGLAAPVLRVACVEAAAYALTLWRYRTPTRLPSLDLAGLPSALVDPLDTELGPAAAKLLVTLHLAECCGEELDGLVDRVRERAPDFDRVTRHELHRWIRLDGLPDREVAARTQPLAVRVGLLEQIRTSDELDWLAEQLRSPRQPVVDEAVLRLLEHGEDGEAQLALALADPPPLFPAIVNSVPMWRSDEHAGDLRGLTSDPALEGRFRFALAMALAERHQLDQVDVALAIVAADAPARQLGWFRREDWDRLAKFVSTSSLALALAASPHPHAYTRVAEWLLAQPDTDRTVLAPLRSFLRAGTERPRYLRRRAAQRLLAAGDGSVAPILLPELFDPEAKSVDQTLVPKFAPEARVGVFEAIVGAALIGGKPACTQRRALMVLDVPKVLDGGGVVEDGFDDAVRRLFVDSTDDTVRTRLARRATSLSWRHHRLLGIASIFAWGVRRGRELTGRLFRIQMTDKRQDFGYTNFDEDRIFVTPLPYFAGDRHGQEVVEALILHELGHHVHHRGEQAEVVWKRAQARGLHGVLNLVADEHLERNLRSFRAEYGDRLKRLAAHAFLHTERDLDWNWLLDTLGAASFAILASKPTAPAHLPGQLRVDRGDLLQALETGGSSWARFARALRMGLGDRWNDPRVAAGLALFKGGFRHADMDELWRITEELARLFADELPLSHVCGGHETLGDAEREGQIARGGVGDEEVQAEVERILDPRQLSKGEGPGKPSNKLAINVGPDERFDLITNVQRVPRDPEAHRKVAHDVARHAHRLRAYLCELGLDLVPRRARLRGRSFDRTRAQAVVLRQDPRMLVARELEIHSDLFIGVLIDCSGSMGLRDLLDKARRFAVLIAEAVRGLRGVEARFWGFTDSVIWDAGDADRCSVTSLETSGGNNDAAALYHAAQIAAGSRRRARLLVMISDGLPTQCSVQALRNLVDQLGRRQQIVCAQVAVRPLEEVCFPHYVLLADEPVELATVRFGELVSKLARRALGR